MFLFITLLCGVVLVLLCVILRHWGRKKQEKERGEMAQHIRRDANSTAGWKEYQ